MPGAPAAISAALARRFQTLHQAEPRVFRAPGRVNLIGEHTDYNDGFVLPMALPQATWVAAARRDDRRLAVTSEAIGATVEIDLDAPPAPRRDWSDYVAGVAFAIEGEGIRLTGANLRIASTVPRGAGLSSSAALEVAVAYALLAMAGVPINEVRLKPDTTGVGRVDRVAIARLCQRAENTFVGARCGIMDQFVATHAVAGHALWLDCRSLHHEPVAMPDSARVIVAHTGVQHGIASGEYNARRSECEAAAARLGARSLRDVGAEDVSRAAADLPATLMRRARHVVSENHRVLAVVAALRAGQIRIAGALMTQSHESLRDDFQVSGPELDLMVELALNVPGVLGARMTGGGFGGCTVTLVESESAGAAVAELRERYAAATSVSPDIWIASAAAAADEVAAGDLAGPR